MGNDFKLGLNPSIIDKRTIRFASILNVPALPTLPESYDVDEDLRFSFKEDVLGNDKWGDCVIAGRGNQTWRFEYCSQKKQIPITADDCLTEYWLEQGYVKPKCFLQRAVSPPPDNGLSMLESLKAWRSNGWKVSDGKKYDIFAFAQVPVGNNRCGTGDPQVEALCDKRDKLLKYAIYLLGGALLAVSLQQSAREQFEAGIPWDLLDPPDTRVIGGHCVYACGWNEKGWKLLTWGKKIEARKRFWRWNCVEAWAVVDNKNPWQPNDPINIPKLQGYLNAIDAEGG